MLGRVPDEAVGRGSTAYTVAVARNTEIVVVGGRVVAVCRCAARLEIQHTSSHSVEEHHDIGRAARPKNRTVLTVVGDRPDAGGGLDEGLVSVVVELRDEGLTRRRGERRVGDGGVLVEAVRNIRTVSTEVEGSQAVADVVVLVGVFGRGRAW